MKKKIVWGITGAGDFLPEVVDELKNLTNEAKIDTIICLSKAAEKVLKRYKLIEKVKEVSKKVLVEQDANTPFIAGPLQIGKYHSLLIAPTTANTVAKIVHGIADTLITNAMAQAQKGGTPVIILPVDLEPGEKITVLPSGKEIKLKMRNVDIENVEKLKNMNGITLLKTPEDIGKFYKTS